MEYKRLADIFSNLESKLILNQKSLFSSYRNASTSNIWDFISQMLSRQTLLERQNIKATTKAFNDALICLNKTIDKSYNNGVDSISKQLGIKIDVRKNDRAELLRENAKQTLNRICNIVVSSSVSIFTSIVSSLSAYKYAPDIYSAIDLAQSQSLEKGVIGSVNSNGATINLTTFADIIEGEYEHSAILTGEGYAQDETKNYLIVISEHFGCCDKCRKWENQVLINDTFADGKPDGKHELLSTAIADGLFHPNCRHRFRVALNNETEPKDKQDWSKEQNRRQYQASQKQRYIERNIRAYKRRELGSMSESEQLKAHQKVLEWQARQRDLIKETNSQDGLRLFREYERERIGGGTKPQMAQELYDNTNFTDDINYLKLPYKQKNALNKYLSSDSYKINETLRKNLKLDRDKEEIIDNLNKAINNLPKI